MHTISQLHRLQEPLVTEKTSFKPRFPEMLQIQNAEAKW